MSLSLSLSIIRFDPQAVRMRQTEQELDMINCWNLCKINYDMNDDDALLNRYGICARAHVPPTISKFGDSLFPFLHGRCGGFWN